MSDFLVKAFDVIVEPVLWLLFAAATIVFFWGIAEFIRDSGSEDGRRKGQQHILWGIVGFAIMFSVLGLTRIIANTLQLQESDRPTLLQDGGDTGFFEERFLEN